MLQDKKKWCNPTQIKWSEEEKETLKKLYGDMNVSIEEIMDILPMRSYSAIYSKANSMKLVLRTDIMQRELEKMGLNGNVTGK
jgi:hypothetical protein